MRIAPGWMTFLIGLVLLAAAGIAYQQSLLARGAAAPPPGASTTATSSVKYACPMRCAESDTPGQCPICGMEMTAIDVAPAAVTAGPSGNQPALYTCPMHPQVVQDHPGTCPICGMELVPKVDDTAAAAEQMTETVAAVKLSPTQAVLADVQAVHPTRESMALQVPAIGEVSVPQDRVRDVVSWQEGRVDNLVLAQSGGAVEEGQHVLDIYSEPLIEAQEEYLMAIRAVNELGNSEYPNIAQSSEHLFNASKQKLLRLGFTAKQLAEIAITGKPMEHVPISSTASGYVLDKMVTEGMYVMRGEKLFTVADLDRVWVELNVFENDIASIKPGDKVSMKCPIHPGMTFKGTVEIIEPELDMESRTFKVRVAVDNPELILRPGMIMDAELTFDYGKLLLLPRNAVLHTGNGDLVYVLVGENQWVPRQVTVGRDFGEKVEILSGLSAKEAVAGTAVFLLDSEAQLKGVPRPQNLPAAPTVESGDGHQHGK